LCMPHSPRLHDGQLWLLESGTGQLALIDPASGRRQVVTELTGFARSLAFAGPYAFVGLSKIRPTSAMDGVPLVERRDHLKCGVAVVDVRTGQVCAFLEFQTAVEEIFDVQLLGRENRTPGGDARLAKPPSWAHPFVCQRGSRSHAAA